MKTIFYTDKTGNYHSFCMTEKTLDGILAEFQTVENYLRSVGVSFCVCGAK